MNPAYWLLKTEPETYSFDQLLREKTTNWDLVRNFQARNFLREVRAGDQALIYHSGDVKSVVGLATVIREAYPDPDEDRDDWVQIDVKAVASLPKPVSLQTIKATPELKDMPLIRHTRLSVMPLTRSHFETLAMLGKGDR